MGINPVTPDIRPKWLNVTRRLQAAASLNNGTAIITISVIIRDSDPEGWTAPRITLIEPKANKDAIIATLMGSRDII